MDLVKLYLYARFVINLVTLLMRVGIDMLRIYTPQPRHFGIGRGQRSAYMANLEPPLALLYLLESHILLITLITKFLISNQ